MKAEKVVLLGLVGSLVALACNQEGHVYRSGPQPPVLEKTNHVPKNPIAYLNVVLYDQANSEKSRLIYCHVACLGFSFHYDYNEEEGKFLLIAYTTEGNPFFSGYFNPKFSGSGTPDSAGVALQIPLCIDAGYGELYRVSKKSGQKAFERVLRFSLEGMFSEGLSQQISREPRQGASGQ